MQLSPNFTLAELTTSQTAARHGISNTPDAATIANLKRLCVALEAIRAHTGGPIVVSSGYRSRAVNAAVGGSSTSSHMSGLAADINRPGMTPKRLAQAIKDSGVIFDQLIMEFDGWVHFGLSTGRPRGQVLTIRNGTGYMAGLV